MFWGGDDVMLIEIKYTINVIHLNHPQNMPPNPAHGKVVFYKTGPWCHNGWGLLGIDYCGLNTFTEWKNCP